MAFKIKNIHETQVLNLNFEHVNVAKDRIPTVENSPNWKCAINDSEKSKIIVFTQLISSSVEMRDGLYYYLLAINLDPIIIEWESGKASIYNRGNASSYPIDYLKQLSDEASIVLTYDQKPLIWKHNNEIPKRGYLTNA